MKLDKKGQFTVARKTIYWMIAGFIITMIVLTFAITLSNYQSRLSFMPPELKAELTAFRFTHIPECFVMQEKNILGIEKEDGRVLAGIIDLEKFNQTVMNKCYNPDKEIKGLRQMNFRLELEKAGKSVSNYFYKHQKMNKLTMHKEVLVWDDSKRKDKLTKDKLIIYVQDI